MKKETMVPKGFLMAELVSGGYITFRASMIMSYQAKDDESVYINFIHPRANGDAIEVFGTENDLANKLDALSTGGYL
jgi:hypothetical protein